jgi:hypothetical protein
MKNGVKKVYTDAQVEAAKVIQKAVKKRQMGTELREYRRALAVERAQSMGQHEKEGVTDRAAKRSDALLHAIVKTNGISKPHTSKSSRNLKMAAGLGLLATALAKTYSKSDFDPSVDAVVASTVFTSSSAVTLAVLEAGQKAVEYAYNYFKTPINKEVKSEQLTIDWKKDEDAMDIVEDVKESNNFNENGSDKDDSESKSTQSNDSNKNTI